MLRFLAVLPTLFLSACAFIPEDKYTFYPQEQAQAMVLAKAGTEVPPGIVIAPTYEEYFTKYAAWGATWDCTGWKLKSGTKLLIVQLREGNLIRGVHVTAEQCSDPVQLTFEGRFNATHLYIRFSPDKPEHFTAVRRYRLVDGGKKLIEEENYQLKNGQPYTHVYPKSGADRDDRKYETSYFEVSKITMEEVLAKASVNKAKAEELLAQKRKNEEINWGAAAAGLSGIVADAKNQQAANIAVNEKRRQQTEAQLREQLALQTASAQQPSRSASLQPVPASSQAVTQAPAESQVKRIAQEPPARSAPAAAAPRSPSSAQPYADAAKASQALPGGLLKFVLIHGMRPGPKSTTNPMCISNVMTVPGPSGWNGGNGGGSFTESRAANLKARAMVESYYPDFIQKCRQSIDGALRISLMDVPRFVWAEGGSNDAQTTYDEYRSGRRGNASEHAFVSISAR